jgi:hypothetical protein
LEWGKVDQIFLFGYRFEPGKPEPTGCWAFSADPEGMAKLG